MRQPTSALRCAIYTRVSSDHGLDQEFSSLDNQREAAEAYIKSQAHEGWRCQPERYDDGGFSGGSLDRPALQRLLGMARRLYRFMTLLAVPAILLGLWLYIGYGIGMGPGNGWMHAKLLLVVFLIGYHHACGVMLRKFEQGRNKRPHTFYRWFNEIPVLLLVLVVALVVIKPF